MKETLSIAREVLQREYQKIFKKNWSFMTGGVLIGLLSILTFAWARPWGVAGGIRNWGDWFFYWAGFFELQPAPILTSGKTILAVGLLWGALAAALIAKQFALRVPPTFELIKGAAGGLLLGAGAALAGGCNVGGFYSSIAAFSFSGFTMMIGLLLGAYAGLRYLYWELEHLPFAIASTGPRQPSSQKSASKIWQPALGFALIIGGYGAKEIYRLNGHIITGGLLLCGIAFGFILHRSRFCFARCFREPFMTGDAATTRAVVTSLLICALGFAVIKWTGLRSELAFTAPSVGLGGLVGGFIFGFGMLLAGGCGSGTIWRVAEGQVKLMATLFTFALSTSLTKYLIRSTEGLKSFIGWKVFLPNLLGYPMAMAFIFIAMGAWYYTVTWNEETEYFVVEL